MPYYTIQKIKRAHYTFTLQLKIGHASIQSHLHGISVADIEADLNHIFFGYLLYRAQSDYFIHVLINSDTRTYF